MKLITDFYALAKKALSQGVNVDKIIDCGWIEKLIKVKYDIPNDKIELFDEYEKNIKYDTIICLIFLKIGYVIKQNSGFKLCAFDRINMIDKCNPLHATNSTTIPTFLTTTIGGIHILQGL